MDSSFGVLDAFVSIVFAVLSFVRTRSKRCRE